MPAKPVDSLAPQSFHNVREWASAHGRTVEEAERRFYLLTAIRAVASDEQLSERLVLRGSGALWLRFLPDRLPNDLDYIDVARTFKEVPPEPLHDVETRVRQRLGSYFRSVVPTGASIRRAQAVVGLELTPKYADFPIELYPVGRGLPSVRTCVLDQIFAEKPCAIADQIERNQPRLKHVVDCFVVGQRYGTLVTGSSVMRFVEVRRAIEGGQVVEADFFDRPLREWVMKRTPESSHHSMKIAWDWLVHFLRTHRSP